MVPFLDLPPELRRILYTTNAIESFDVRVRKLINGKGPIPNDAALELIYLAVVAAEKRWTRPPKSWSQAFNQFAIKFEGRLPV